MNEFVFWKRRDVEARHKDMISATHIQNKFRERKTTDGVTIPTIVCGIHIPNSESVEIIKARGPEPMCKRCVKWST